MKRQRGVARRRRGAPQKERTNKRRHDREEMRGLPEKRDAIDPRAHNRIVLLLYLSMYSRRSLGELQSLHFVYGNLKLLVGVKHTKYNSGFMIYPEEGLHPLSERYQQLTSTEATTVPRFLSSFELSHGSRRCRRRAPGLRSGACSESRAIAESRSRCSSHTANSTPRHRPRQASLVLGCRGPSQHGPRGTSSSPTSTGDRRQAFARSPPRGCR